PMALLDPTHPEAAHWLSEVFRRLRAEGFDLFKVDFTQEILKARRFQDMTLGRAGLLRRAFTIIREAIGEDAYLLACGAPFESVTGLVDSVRVTGDIHNLWGHVPANFSAMSARWWMSGTLWNVDADFLLARCEDTTEDRQFNRERVVRPHDPVNYWMAGRDLNLEEIRTLGLMIYLSGGDIVLGDALPKLNEKGFRLLRRILDAPPVRTMGRPLDLFARHEQLPSQMLAREDWGAALGLFNWSEDPAEVIFDPLRQGLPKTGTVEDFWTGERIPYDGEIRRALAPRSAAGLLFT
ncbi:MAG: hypothetical protein U1E27_01395, partial [Kiritimatiellia bacterium]|nr:hypothetical protein [Kiritimatiellia bacterium]